ncbi:MAG TPA: hypothetical protein VFN54_09125 [Acidimicrobiales bacterium]|nr:hypothetical protein [Acidimicrobiales bacterium]
MLTRLMRTYLRSRTGSVALVVVLLVAQTVGNLYLTNLNAAIINNGVVTGNLGYILRTGAAMLAITLAIGGVAIVAVYWASRIAMAASRIVEHGSHEDLLARRGVYFDHPAAKLVGEGVRQIRHTPGRY